MLPSQVFENLNLILQCQNKRLVLIITKSCFDWNRHGEGVACYGTNDLSYYILSVFPREIENIFFESLPNSKPITVGKIHRPQNKTNFLEVLSNKMNKINPVDNEIYIFGDFNIYLFLNDSYILEKKNILISKSIPSDAKSYHELYFRKKRIF